MLRCWFSGDGSISNMFAKTPITLIVYIWVSRAFSSFFSGSNIAEKDGACGIYTNSITLSIFV